MARLRTEQPAYQSASNLAPLGPGPQPFSLCSSESHAPCHLVGLGRENVALITAAPIGPLVISRLSRSMVAHYSEVNKTACDRVSVTLAPFHSFSSLSAASHRARVTTGSQRARRPSPRQKKAAPPRAPLPARAPTDGWMRRHRVASRWCPTMRSADGDLMGVGGASTDPFRRRAHHETAVIFYLTAHPRPAVVTHQ
jgi:hypothetical protein